MKHDSNLVKQEILSRIRLWTKQIQNVKDFVGSSPPSIFVGRHGYPKVFVGILAPTEHQQNAALLDSPEKWYTHRSSIEEILGYRGQMIYSRFKTTIKPKNKLSDLIQELAMAKKQTDVEIRLKRNPTLNVGFNPWITPIANPAPIDSAKLTENPHVERKVDYTISDVDRKAEKAVIDLYKYKLPVSRIQKIFSAGLLGSPIQRKFVPTRWGITAVDDILGKNLMKKIRGHVNLNEMQLFSNEYLGNHYEILLIPGAYQYELIEIWHMEGKQPGMSSDYEPFGGKKSYAVNTHGAFYSGRLAVLEYLEKIKRQATILIVREILPTYIIPMGIWQMRETVRGAFNKKPEKFDSVEKGIVKIASRIKYGDKWIKKSKLLRFLKEQRKVKEFLHPY